MHRLNFNDPCQKTYVYQISPRWLVILSLGKHATAHYTFCSDRLRDVNAEGKHGELYERRDICCIYWTVSW